MVEIQVRRDGDNFWLAAPLAAKKSGLSKAQLTRRALAGELRYQQGESDKYPWYAEDQIAQLAKAKIESDRAKATKPKRQMSDAALEARHTRQWTKQAKTARYGMGGPVAAHQERVILYQIAENNSKKRDSEV